MNHDQDLLVVIQNVLLSLCETTFFFKESGWEQFFLNPMNYEDKISNEGHTVAGKNNNMKNSSE